MKNIQAILFDFGGTLDHDGADWFSRLYQRIVARGIALDQAQFNRYADTAAHNIMALSDTPRLTMEATVYRLCQHLQIEIQNHNGANLPPWDPRQVAQEFMRESKQYLLRNRTVIQKLRENFRLGVISNNWGNTAGWCRQFRLSPYFDVMIDSAIFGITKPHKLIFQAALDQLALPAELCAYVGDRYDCDVMGAHAAGLKPIWITNTQQKNSAHHPLAACRINKLPDLLKINWQHDK